MKYKIHMKKEGVYCIRILGHWYDRVYRNWRETIFLKKRD